MKIPLRKAIHERLLGEMIGSVGDAGIGGGWKVLVLCPVSTRILSSTVKMSDIMARNVSVVESLHKDRQPLPLPALYFMQPTQANITRLLADFEGGSLPYPAVHVYFTSQLRPRYLDQIKACAPLLAAIRALKETNLEYLMVDSRTVVTDIPVGEDTAPPALVRFMGPAAGASRRDGELSGIAERLATLFSTLKDFPAIRYHLPPATAPGDAPGAAGRSTLTQRLATALLEKLDVMQRAGALPPRDTCDLVILDRSYDPVAPFIHEWTYEAMVYDLLTIDPEDNTYRYEAESSSKRVESKEAIIDERDPMWVDLRHMFIAEVYAHIADRFKQFQAKNKAAKAAGAGAVSRADMSLGAIKSLITALPQFHDLLSRMSLHVQMSGQIKTATNSRLLTELGELEQDLALGDKNSKHMVQFLADHSGKLAPEDVMRLLMTYVGTHPEKCDIVKQKEWQLAGGLTDQQMCCVLNMAYLGVKVMKGVGPPDAKSAGSFFGKRPPTAAALVERGGLRAPKTTEDEYSLFRFEPLLRSIIEAAHNGKLSDDDYPYIRAPSAFASEASASAASQPKRQGALNWAKRDAGGGSAGAGSGNASRRLIVFVLGGACRSEMRVVHEAATALGRDVLLASTSIESPASTMHALTHIAGEAASTL
ncbi:hypothetical protein FOA52_007347 [Chlamydomonas sp. UWO 241]|nr:hypothetical protein FOA52_007347 [Chlamydomonas sp. UWO 241]